MRILIFGATGITGKILTKMALNQGHTVTIFVRNPSKIDFEDKQLNIVQGQLHEIEKIDKVIQNQEVVISTLGPTSLTKNNIEFTDGIAHIVKTIEKHQIKQFFYLSTMGVGDSRNSLDWFSKYFIMDFVIKKSVQDHTKNEQNIINSQTNWYIFRPAKLNNKTLTKNYKVSEYFVKAFRPKISRADVADLMLAQIGKVDFLRKKISQMY
ncbi:MAG: NAD(P)H-binding protein [Thermoflexibacter sp.]|jgi:putative NADH-flavin reductase|nr:NAD(P)H-binding protein [Thermoflexibacter sp.]